MLKPIHHKVGKRPAAFLLISLFFLPFQQCLAQDLQRLFYTAEERSELDRLRQVSLGLLQAPAIEEAPAAQQPAMDSAVPDVIIRLGGIVRQADGSYMLWLNDEAIAADALPDYIEIPQEGSGSIRVHDPDSGSSFLVKPGQLLNLTRGILLESYDSAAIAMLREAQLASEVSNEPAAVMPGDDSGDQAKQRLEELEAAREDLQ